MFHRLLRKPSYPYTGCVRKEYHNELLLFLPDRHLFYSLRNCYRGSCQWSKHLFDHNFPIQLSYFSPFVRKWFYCLSPELRYGLYMFSTLLYKPFYLSYRPLFLINPLYDFVYSLECLYNLLLVFINIFVFL